MPLLTVTSIAFHSLYLLKMLSFARNTCIASMTCWWAQLALE